jgi:hypothetical protein
MGWTRSLWSGRNAALLGRLASVSVIAVLLVGLLPVTPVAATYVPGPLPPVLHPSIDPTAAMAIDHSSASSLGDVTASTTTSTGPGLSPSATEIPARRTANSNTFDNHDGTYTTNVSPGPINYLPSGAATYQPIDTTLAPISGNKNGRVQAAHTSTPIEVGAADDAPGFVSLDSGSGVVSLHLAPGMKPGKAGSRPTTNGSRGDLSGLMAGIDLETEVGNTGVVTYFILSAVPRQDSWTLSGSNRCDSSGSAR